MTAFCALMLVASANTGDTGAIPTTATADTGSVVHTGAPATTPPNDTGAAGGSGGLTSSTGDTGTPQGTVLAADIAKEVGGVGCVVTPAPATWCLVLVGAALARRRP
ncbi:MAG: hypothetical protein KC621_25080 [Myxococcales bacterium]|nr:hypothetical protein [Myxococcales bacterium]